MARTGEVLERRIATRRWTTTTADSAAERIALRRGRKIAVVALARRVAGILYAMMRDGTDYRPTQPRCPATNLTSVVAA